jgi:hypothetical protein
VRPPRPETENTKHDCERRPGHWRSGIPAIRHTSAHKSPVSLISKQDKQDSIKELLLESSLLYRIRGTGNQDLVSPTCVLPARGYRFQHDHPSEISMNERQPSLARSEERANNESQVHTDTLDTPRGRSLTGRNPFALIAQSRMETVHNVSLTISGFPSLMSISSCPLGSRMSSHLVIRHGKRLRTVQNVHPSSFQILLITKPNVSSGMRQSDIATCAQWCK